MITLTGGLNGSSPMIAPFITFGEPGNVLMNRFLVACPCCPLGADRRRVLRQRWFEYALSVTSAASQSRVEMRNGRCALSEPHARKCIEPANQGIAWRPGVLHHLQPDLELHQIAGDAHDAH